MTSPKPTAPPPLPDDVLALIRDANDADPQALVDDTLRQAAWSRIEAAVGPSAATTSMGGAAWGVTSKVVVGLVCAVVVAAFGAVVVARGGGGDPTPTSSSPPSTAPMLDEVPRASPVSSALSSSSPSSTASSSAPSSSTAPTRSPASSSTPRPPPSMSTSSSVTSSRETTSENERALIEQAREALAASRFVDVDAALSQHRARHADGVLSEDRDALTVLSLLKQGQIDEARAAARRFDQRFPESLYRPRIQAAIASITPPSP